MSKYNANKAIVDGIEFDSCKEANRYCELKLLQRAGAIKDLELQKAFELIPAQREPDTIGKRGGVIKGKTIEQAVTYRADFFYTDAKTGEKICEDVKVRRCKGIQGRRSLRRLYNQAKTHVTQVRNQNQGDLKEET